MACPDAQGDASSPTAVYRRSMYLTAKMLGKQFTALDIASSGTADIIFRSTDGALIRGHRALFADWDIPVPASDTPQPINLPTRALLILVNIVYYRPVNDWHGITKLCEFLADCGNWPVVDDVLSLAQGNIVDDDVIPLWIIARERNHKIHHSLRRRVASVIGNHPEQFSALQRAPIEAIFDLAESDDACWPNGVALQAVIVEWMRENRESALANAKDLFTTIRFSSIAERQECLSSFRAFISLEFGLDEAEVTSLTTTYSSLKPRLPKRLVLVFGGWNKNLSLKSAIVYDPATNHWVPAPALDMPKPLSYHRCIRIRNDIYLIAGCDQDVFQHNVWKLDLQSLEWQPRCPFPNDQGYQAAAACNGRIYCFGGFDQVRRLSECWMYNPKRNFWAAIAPMKTSRSDAAALVVGDRIYVTGGFDGERTLNRVEIYTPATDSWSDGAPMSQPRSGHAMVLFRGRIYVIGGFQHGRNTNGVEYFDEHAIAWKDAPRMNMDRTNFCAYVMDDYVYVFGGHSGDMGTSVCERFDGTTWEVTHCLPQPLVAGAVVDLPPHHQLISQILKR